MGKWHLVRHGRTSWNREKRVQGHSDPPLNPLGRLQAERLAKKLGPATFGVAYASDLRRATQTAEAILHGRQLALGPAPELRELAYGVWEGLAFTEIPERYPGEYAHYMARSLDFEAPGGESMRQLLTRVRAFKERLVTAHPDEDLLVVGHSGSLNALVVSLLELPPEAMWRFHLDPTSISVVSLHNPGVTLDSWNDTSHLEGLDDA